MNRQAAGRTGIEWCTTTWSPMTGCTKVSAGCVNCYAERLLGGRLRVVYPEGFAPTMRRDRLEVPTHWRKPRVVFVCPFGDLFHEAVPASYIAEVFAVMARCPQHRFLVLSKRVKRLAAFSRSLDWPEQVWAGASWPDDPRGGGVPELHRARVAHRFASYEPLVKAPSWIEPVRGLDWVIVGGESGPGARPLELRWLERMIEQCREAEVPVFVKQLGTAWSRDTAIIGHMRDRRGADMNRWPEGLRIRELPGFGVRGVMAEPSFSGRCVII